VRDWGFLHVFIYFTNLPCVLSPIQRLLFANSELAGRLAFVLTVSTSTLPFMLNLLRDLLTKLLNSKLAMAWRKECEL
jgi:hypothetical protein